MPEEIVLVSSEERVDRDHVVAFLRDLADQIAEGHVRLTRDAETVEVEIPTDLVLEVELEEETEGDIVERSLEVELEWREGGDTL